MARTQQLNRRLELHTAFPISSEMHLPMLAFLYHLCSLCSLHNAPPRFLLRLV